MLFGYNNKVRYDAYNAEEHSEEHTKIKAVFAMASYDDWENVFGMLDRGFPVDTQSTLESQPQRLLNHAFFHKNKQAFRELVNTYHARLDLALEAAKPDEREMMQQFALKTTALDVSDDNINEEEAQLKLVSFIKIQRHLSII